MDIYTIQQLIKAKSLEHSQFINKAKRAKWYYENKNDITRKRSPNNRKEKDSTENPLRNADNRISHNFHQLLVNQKASYLFTYPPLFDIDDKELNGKIVDILGDIYAKEAKDLCIEASNCSVGWLHVWIDKYNNFRYKSICPMQIIPLYSKNLDRELLGILRVYTDMDDEGENFVVYEYWNDKECIAFRKSNGKSNIEFYCMFESTNIDTGTSELVYSIKHNWGRVPFIPFYNNNIGTNDLVMYKGLIDIYDKVYSGFVNDIEDIQEVIFVLTNYGGANLKEFIHDLKLRKAIKVNSDGVGDKSGVETLTIDIPVEAREKLLTLTRKQIFESGQGVDPQDDKIGNASGVALKFKYSLLELKAGLMETEFKLGFVELIRFILIYLGKDPNMRVKTTWTRTAINNDLEQAEIVSRMAPNTSNENIAKSNPIVEDWEDELALQKKELLKTQRMENDYKPISVDDEDAE